MAAVNNVRGAVAAEFMTEPKDLVANLASEEASTSTPTLAAKDAKAALRSAGRAWRAAYSTPAAAGSQPQGSRAHKFAGRWATVGVLSALSLAVIAADLIAFGRGAAGGWVDDFLKYAAGGYAAELTLMSSLAILALTRYGPACMRITPDLASTRGRAVAPGGGAARKVVRTSGPLAGPTGDKPRAAGGGGAPKESAGGGAPPPKRSTMVCKFNQAIDTAARQGDVEKAAQLLNELEQSGGQPESVTYNLVIRACAKKGDALAAERFLKRMEERGVQPTVCTYNTLLDACAKADAAEKCEAWLRHMQAHNVEPNVISFATAIYARARRGDVAGAEAWLRRMKEAGIQPDAVSYNSLIHACGVKGQAADAERWLEEMRAQGLEMSVATYTAVIDACAKSGDVPRGEHWLQWMIEEGVEPNVVTYSAMIDACAKAGNLPRAEYWHDRMTAKGIAPNAHSYSAVINACAKNGAPGGAEAAERWLDRSEKAGVVNDVVVYSSVIDACGKAGDAERAMRVFRRMQANGLRPHIVAYAALARPFAYRGDWIKVESIAQGMAADGVATNEYFVYAQLLAYAVGRPRQPQRAEACFRAGLAQGVQANDHVVGALARAVGRQRCSELMDELCGGREVPLPPPRRTDVGARGTDNRGPGARERRLA